MLFENSEYKEIIKLNPFLAKSNLINNRPLITMRHVFTNNCIIMENYIEKYDEYMGIIDMNDPIEKEKLFRLFFTLLFNFTLTSITMVEHIKQYVNKNKKVNFEYQNALKVVTDFEKSDFYSFLRKFRNYIAHEELPLGNLRYGFNKSSYINIDINLKAIKDKGGFLIQDKSKENKKAILYYNCLGETISIRDLTNRIKKEIDKFYEDFNFEMLKFYIDDKIQQNLFNFMITESISEKLVKKFGSNFGNTIQSRI